MSDQLICSFCYTPRDQVEHMIVGASFSVICDKCIDQAAAIIAEKRAENPQIQQPTSTSE